MTEPDETEPAADDLPSGCLPAVLIVAGWAAGYSSSSFFLCLGLWAGLGDFGIDRSVAPVAGVLCWFAPSALSLPGAFALVGAGLRRHRAGRWDWPESVTIAGSAWLAGLLGFGTAAGGLFLIALLLNAAAAA